MTDRSVGENRTRRLIALLVALALVSTACRIGDPSLEAGLNPPETPTASPDGATGNDTADTNDTNDTADNSDGGASDPKPESTGDDVDGSNDTDRNPGIDTVSREIDQFGLGYSGPSMTSHWHAAYAIRVCNEVLDPLLETDSGSGIHSHGDGVIHIHPGLPDAAWQGATLGLFAAAVGIELSDDKLVIPGVGEWTNGDLCNGVPAELAVHRWVSPDATEPWITHRSNLPGSRLYHDGELFTISFAAPGAVPVKPPSAETLTSLSEALTVAPPNPFVALPENPARQSVKLWVVREITEAPCDPDQVIETALEGAVSGPLLCFTPSETVLVRSDIVSAEARVVNRSPGVVTELSLRGLEQMNEALRLNPSGLRLAIEVDELVVITVAFSQPLFERKFAFTGGMTAVDAEALASLLGAA